MNPYEVLGLDSNADAETIKKAFRRASMQNHPDRGGDQEEMSKVNQANDILSDPIRKAQFDTYGTTNQQPSLQEEAENLLMQMFVGCLSAPFGTFLSSVRDSIHANRQNIGIEKAQMDAALEHLKKRADSIQVSEGTKNLVKLVTDQQIAQIQANFSSFDHRYALMDELAKQLQHYQSTEIEVVKNQRTNTTGTVGIRIFRG